jgi:hypothetical protein
MPWKTYLENGEYCVYKHDSVGNKVGSALGCHATEAEAQTQIAALNANVTEAEDRPPAKTSVLIEAVELVEGSINPQAREVEAVLIRPGWSANGRYYSRDVLARALGLYENSRAFANHPTPDQMRRGEGRSVTDLTGRFFNVRLGEAGEIRATRRVYDNPAGNAVWPAIVDAVEHQAPVIGLSINAVGKVSKGSADGKEGVIVEEITAVSSVDDVIAPAAGGGFERLMTGGDDLLTAVLGTMTLDEWRAARPEFVDSLKKEWQVVRQTEAVATANADRDQAQSALIEAQQQVTSLQQTMTELETTITSLRADVTRKGYEVELEKVLREASLPMKWETELRRQLASTDPAQWLDIVTSERAKAAGVSRPAVVPVEGMPQRVSMPPVLAPRRDGPIYLAEDATPEQLAAELAKRSKA